MSDLNFEDSFVIDLSERLLSIILRILFREHRNYWRRQKREKEPLLKRADYWDPVVSRRRNKATSEDEDEEEEEDLTAALIQGSERSGTSGRPKYSRQNASTDVCNRSEGDDR